MVSGPLGSHDSSLVPAGGSKAVCAVGHRDSAGLALGADLVAAEAVPKVLRQTSGLSSNFLVAKHDAPKWAGRMQKQRVNNNTNKRTRGVSKGVSGNNRELGKKAQEMAGPARYGRKSGRRSEK